MNALINVLLSSTFIAGVTVAVINALSNRKINFTQYFSKERNEWRREIRTIAEELENCRSYRTLSAILTKLKLRINPYGKNMKPVENNEVTVGMMQDAHIWKIIEEMENDRELKNFDVDKDYLVMYLSLLLKHDWEKEKRDFKGNIYWVILIGTLILSFIYVTYNHFYVLKKGFNIEYMMWILLVVEMPAGIAGIIQCIKDMSNYKQKKVLYVIALLGLVAFGVYEMNSLIAYYGGIGMIEDFDFLFAIVVYLIWMNFYPVLCENGINTKYMQSVKTIYDQKPRKKYSGE